MVDLGNLFWKNQEKVITIGPMKKQGKWITHGFDGFSQGTFGNGGQNLYVSSAGVLQRIYQFDLNKNGYFDLVFVNSQDMNERPNIYVYDDPLGLCEKFELPTEGAYAGVLADVNGDGYDDLIVGHQNNGSISDLAAFIYWGSPEGLTERYKTELHAPNCRAVAAGDFNGSGRMDIAFASAGKLRIFYQQESGFIVCEYVDLDINVDRMVAGDLDKDGFADLYIRCRQGKPKILWGGRDGINLDRYTDVGGAAEPLESRPSTTPDWRPIVIGWTPKIVSINGRTYLFRMENHKAHLYPIAQDRTLGKPLIFDHDDVVSVAAGDINHNGLDDVVLVVCTDPNKEIMLHSSYAKEHESSWIYWADKNGFDEKNQTEISTIGARDVAISDLNGNGFGDVLICQGSTDVLHDTDSLIFCGCPDGIGAEPIKLPGRDAATALIGRTSDKKNPQVVLINHVGGRVRGDVPIYIYHGGPDGYSEDRREELPGWAAPDAVACDFNDNGWVDLFVSNCSENAVHLDPGSFLYWGGSQGYSYENKEIFRTFRANGTAAGDFRHSGYLDIAVVGFQNPEMLIYRQGPNGFDLENPEHILLDPNLKEYTPTTETVFDECREIDLNYSEPRWMFAADFNNNGWLDLFVSQINGQRCLIMWGGPDGFSMDRITWLNVEGASCAQPADLTGNGYLDLVIGQHYSMSRAREYDSGVFIYWASADGFRDDRRTRLPIHACNSLTVADFNNNGILDIFATCYKNGVVRDLDSYLYWGSEGGNYSFTNRTRFFSHSPSGCMSGDFNNNGWIDIAVASHKTYGNHEGLSQVWWNGPDGFSEQRRTFLPTKGPHGMLTVDPGNIMDRGPEEYYISAPLELPNDSRITKIQWQGEIPPKTWVKAQIRLGSTKEKLNESPWQGPDGNAETWFENAQQPNKNLGSARYLQYKLTLGATNSLRTPRITQVTIDYESEE